MNTAVRLKTSQIHRQPNCLLWAVVMLLAGSSVVSAQKVKVGYDKTADFSKYTTYTWAPPGVPPTRPLLYRHVVGAIDEHLKSEGLADLQRPTALD